jgi:hypothetical protein
MEQNETIKEASTDRTNFDLKKVRLNQNFSEMVGVKKALTTVPVRKPNRQEFVRVHPDDSMHLPAGVLELKEERETYLVDSDLWSELQGEIIPKILITTINRQGVLMLWPINLPGEDGRINSWSESAMEAANLAKEKWVRVAANMSLGGYETFIATGNIPNPEWPDKPLHEIVSVAFKGRYVESMDHPLVQRLYGAE